MYTSKCPEGEWAPFMEKKYFVLEDEIEISNCAVIILRKQAIRCQGIFQSNVIQDAEDNYPSCTITARMIPNGNRLNLYQQSIRGDIARCPDSISSSLIPESAEEHRIQNLESGADDCIVRPFDPRELVRKRCRILHLLDRRTDDGEPDCGPIKDGRLAMKVLKSAAVEYRRRVWNFA